MNWKFINQPLCSGEISGGYAPREKRWVWLIPAAISAATAIAGGISSANANKKARRQLDSERAANQAERRRNKYEEWTDTPQGQNIMRKLRETVDQTWKKEAGAAAVAGNTDSAKQMAKDAAVQAVANTVADITVNDQERRDARDDSYRKQDQAYASQQMALDQQAGAIKAQATSQLVSAIGNAAASYMGASMGTGSPAGGGVTATGNTGSALNNMAATPSSTNVPITPEAQTYMQAGMMGHYNNYNLAAPIWYRNFMGGTKW